MSSKTSSTSKWKPNKYQKQILQGMVDAYNNNYLPSATNLSDISNSQRQGLASQTLDYSSMLDSANSQISSAQQGLADLTTDGLPSEYLQQITNSLSSVSDNLMGGSVNNLVAKGIMSSSQGNKVLSDNSQNINNLVNQQYSNYMNQLSNLYNNQVQNATAQINAAGLAQGNAQGAADNSLTASLNNYNAASGILGTGGTTTQSSSNSSGLLGSLIGAAGSIGGAIIACFTGDTDIVMADGICEKIKDIRKGDVIKCFNYNTNKIEDCKVIKVCQPRLSKVYRVIVENGTMVNTTLTQPFMKSNGEWVKVSDLTIGTDLANVGKVRAIAFIGTFTVYDLCVDGCGNYIANEFIAKDGTDNGE